MGYRYLNHRADIAIEVKERNLEDLLRTSLKALCDSISPAPDYLDDKLIDLSFELESIDSTSLLVEFLSEILFLIHENNTLFCKVEFLHFEECYLKVRVIGRKVNRFEEDIKAVTYHEAEIKYDAGFYKTNLVFDI